MTGTEMELGLIALTGEPATQWVRSRLEHAGLRTYRSFDLRTARLSSSDCACPDHGSDLCDCQMVVLLVYPGRQGVPATVILHGHQGQTWVTLAEGSETALEDTITGALALARLEPDEAT